MSPCSPTPGIAPGVPPHRPTISRYALGLLLAAGCARAPEPSTVVVAAAADLKFALDELLGAYRQRHPEVAVNVVYGSSGNFHAQLQNEAPFDLYFSADVEYPRRLAAQGLALGDDVFLYAVGRIVLWVPNNSPLDVERLGGDALLDPAVRRIAIANPQHAPYGRAAVAALRSLGVHDRVADKLVLGENIAQTAQFVESGAADVGVLALSLALAPAMHGKGRHYELPPASYPRMDQGGMVTRWARHPEAAKSVRDFVLAESGRAVLKRYGFFLPE